MKKRKNLIALVSLILCFAFVLTACSGGAQNGKEETPGGDGSVSTPFAEGDSQGNTDSAEQETLTVAKKPSKYSAEEKLIALTYDDGPYTKTTSQILEVLKENNSAATFFIVGNRINDGTSAVLRQAVDYGCEIANHTYEHKNLMKATDSERAHQIKAANDAVNEYAGVVPTLLRAPGGNYKGVEDKVGMPLIQWTIDTEDWRNKDASNKSRTPEERQAKIDEIVNDVLSDVQAGDIILMHDIYNFTVDLTKALVPKLVEQGYKLVTVSEMFEAYSVELEAGGVYRHARPASADSKPSVDPGIYTVSITSDPTLNLRDKVGAGSVVLTEIPNGATVTVLQCTDGWANVTYNEYTGWVSANYLKPYKNVDQ